MKKGFSLIELVFAIVIIGISVSVLPRIIVQSQKSNEFAIKQELIFHAKSMMGRVMQGAWDSGHLQVGCRYSPACDDANITQVNNFPMPVPIYNIALQGGNANERVGILNFSKKFPGESDNLRWFSKGGFISTAPINFGRTSHGIQRNLNDIDDFNDQNFTINPLQDNGDFLIRTTVRVSVNYMRDNWNLGNHRNELNIIKNLSNDNTGVSATATNIKRVIVDAFDGDIYNVRLVGYFTNIGQAFFRTKEWK
ncbi:putative type II secretion system protein [Campylobacter blaseri]|uniref:Prepilin-type cleavage/methylation domain-containing protein n=1 Tax=Campylobacter blaseri TaxID=2042961 RepID=A0A2P8R201_9BACT|nr:type II secretion system protein [Campylobacter blaseri]PSM52525.1 hypothetical protein CQ405_02015 [Campylobacter blaseri]PSM54173.1 hypothetical protein CRN67_02015 [Campylobacter blaseri]QKF85823.1 putative type II secretion system protein [Campylobacter blaseri]